MSARPLVCVEEFGSSLSQPASLLIAMMAQEVGAVEKQVAGRVTGQCPPASMWPGPACNVQGLSGAAKTEAKTVSSVRCNKRRCSMHAPALL